MIKAICSINIWWELQLVLSFNFSYQISIFESRLCRSHDFRKNMRRVLKNMRTYLRYLFFLHPACRIWFLASKSTLGLFYSSLAQLDTFCGTNKTVLWSDLQASIWASLDTHVFVNSSILNNTYIDILLFINHGFMKRLWRIYSRTFLQVGK